MVTPVDTIILPHETPAKRGLGQMCKRQVTRVESSAGQSAELGRLAAAISKPLSAVSLNPAAVAPKTYEFGRSVFAPQNLNTDSEMIRHRLEQRAPVFSNGIDLGRGLVSQRLAGSALNAVKGLVHWSSERDRVATEPANKVQLPNFPYPVFRIDTRNQKVGDPMIRYIESSPGTVNKVGSGYPSEVCYEYTSCKLGIQISLSDTVAQLVKEGYEVVKTPRTNDIILYFTPEESTTEFKHIWLVTKVENDTVWVESKWGVWDIYEHLEEHVSSNYGNSVVYLHDTHSDRVTSAQYPPGQCNPRGHMEGARANLPQFLPRAGPKINLGEAQVPAWKRYAEQAFDTLEREWKTESSESNCRSAFNERFSQQRDRSVSNISKVLEDQKFPIKDRVSKVVGEIELFRETMESNFNHYCGKAPQKLEPWQH